MSARIVEGRIEIDKEVTAVEIAHALARGGGKLIEPTAQQRAIIESRHFGPTVIIAGAGSGKTETMSQRVLWLVANGVVTPDQILGLTFTRKAAGELATRIRKRLRQLRAAGLLPTEGERALPLDIAVDVSTYHSYAGRTLSAHGIRMGIDTDGEPLGEAAAWQLTYKIVNSFEEVDHEIFHKPDFIVDAVMALSGELGEHNRTTAEIRPFLEDFMASMQSVTTPSNESVRDALETISERLAILPMVEKLDQHRLETGQLTFNDQMSYAAKLAERVPEISEIERARYKVVLLDEYQDTSYSQVRFLSSLFGDGHPVTAVGDPNQAIYGWRGASAETLGSFAATFGGNCQHFDLLTTWRNDQKILDFSNLIIGQIGELAQLPFGVKQLRARPEAGDGNLSCGLYITPEDEAAAIADYFAKLWFDPARQGQSAEQRSSFAVLVRVKSYIPLIEAALREREMPTEVIGVGGLIHIPEIADIIALLRLITYPDAGSALARLLVGPRLALAPKDLHALGSYSRALARKSSNARSDRLESILEFGSEENLDANDFAIGSIIEALELIDEAPRSDFSAEGFARLKEFARELAALRRTMTGSITDKVQSAERFLRLDVETLVRDGWNIGRRHLDKFFDEAAAFARTGGTISSFLAWLETAEKREGGLKPATVIVTNSAVQILTIHGAKGAEWDVVAVPGLLKDVFPNKPMRSSSWIKYAGSLPIAFRGDRLQLTDFEFPQGGAAIKPAEVGKAIKRFEDAHKARHYLEELRLGYVAFTRAKSHLFCTASWFRDGKDPVDQSPLFTALYDFLESSAATSVLSNAELPEENPRIAQPRTATWPGPRSRAEAIRRSAELVASVEPLDLESALRSEVDPDRLSMIRDAKALLNEIEKLRGGEIIYLPHRLSVSTLINLRSDPEELALNIRRPMPRHTDKYAKRGTEFHLWVERQFGAQTLFDEDLFDPLAHEDVPLKELQDKWLASSWAGRSPIAVEEGFETVINGTVLRGRIDAIYRDGDTYEVVDWKTGRIKDGEDLTTASIQLAMYRLAYSKQHQIPIEKIRAAFHYVADNKTIYRENLSSEEEIAALISSVDIASVDLNSN
jgi:DNA helicase-2/ATP-dependent DNA helicase PcrA